MDDSRNALFNGCVLRIDQLVNLRNRGVVTVGEAVDEIKSELDEYLAASFLDPREDRATVMDWAIEAVRDVCSRDSELDVRQIELFAIWLDERLSGEVSMRAVELDLDDLEAQLANGNADANRDLAARCKSHEPIPATIALRLIDLAYQQRDHSLLAAIVDRGGLATRFPAVRGVTDYVLNRLSHLAHEPTDIEARSTMVDLLDNFDLASRVAIRLPSHLLTRDQVRALATAVDNWTAFVQPTEPWPAPNELHLARLALRDALIRCQDSARLRS